MRTPPRARRSCAGPRGGGGSCAGSRVGRTTTACSRRSRTGVGREAGWGRGENSVGGGSFKKKKNFKAAHPPTAIFKHPHLLNRQVLHLQVMTLKAYRVHTSIVNTTSELVHSPRPSITARPTT